MYNSEIIEMFIQHVPEIECVERSRFWPAYCTAAARLIVKYMLEEKQLPGMPPEDPISEARPNRGSQAGRRVKRREVLGFTQVEVAKILGMSERGVREVEKRALRKLRAHPELRQFWAQYGSELEEAFERLTLEEVAALFGLARTPQELGLLYQLIRTIQ